MSLISSRPKRTSNLPFARPDIGANEIDAVREVLESGWLTTGAKTHAFEARFAERVGARHALALSSCTAALHLALEAAGVRPGDEVITSTYTFAATAEVIHYLHARPVLVDIDAATLNLDPARVADAITPRTKAIVPVDIGGLAADFDALREASGEIALIEDAAHAFPATYKGRSIGSVSDITCFSFYATKTITTGEGGMLCTDDDHYAERCRTMALHGLSRDAWGRYSGGSWRYDIVAPGFKYNMTDIAAALGLAQLEKADSMRRRRAAIAERYDDAFATIAELVERPARRTDSDHAWHLYSLRLNLERLTISRDTFIEELRRHHIDTSVHFIPLHLHSHYVQEYEFRPSDFPVALAQYEREISLPIYSRMSDDDVDDVIDAVQEIARTSAS